MFKSNKFFYLVAILISFSAATFVSAQVSDVTPLNNVGWSAGSTQDVGWNTPYNNYYRFSSAYTISLVPADSGSLPTRTLSTFAGDGSGPPWLKSVAIPSDVVPGAYRVKVHQSVFNFGSSEGLSAGIVTLSNPSFQPLILISPTAPVTYTAGVDVGNVAISIRVADVAVNLLPAGTSVTIKLIKKSDQSVVWQKADSLTDIGSPYPYLSSGLNFEDVSTIPVGTYFFRDEMQDTNGQNYSIDSADLIFTASTPPPPPPPDSNKFVIGDRVVTTAVVNVRDSANGTVIDTKQSDAHGTVIGGPTDAGGFTWWQIDYDCGDTGWSAEHLLDKYTGSVVDDCDGGPPPPPPPPHRSWAPPLYSPPDCDGSQGFDPGCYPPLNVSIESQTKSGLLTVGGLISTLGATIQGVFRLPSGWQTGYVLTATNDNKAEWQPGGTGPNGTPDNYSCPDGQSIGTISNGSVTRCEPDDTGGGGPTDPNVWQKRVGSSCAEGSSIRVIDVNGGVTCETDDVGTGGGGGDITGINTATLSGLEGGVDSGTANLKLRTTCGENDILKYRKNSAGVFGWLCSSDESGSGGGNPGSSFVCDASNKKLLWDGSTWKCDPDLVGATYTADGTTLQLSTANQFSIKPAASNVSRTLVSLNGVVGWGSSVLTRSYSSECSASGGLGQTNNCTIGSLGDYAFCALTSMDTGDGKCEVGTTASNWVINVRTDVGITTCRAVCFKF